MGERMRKILIGVSVCMVTAAGLMAMTGLVRSEPESIGEALYKADGSNILWFIQISDTHISTFFNEEFDERLEWVLSEVVDTVDPWFVATTGDLTDSTDGVAYGTGPHLDEWMDYRAIVEASGLGPEFYFDMPGNHDAYGDVDTSFYHQFGISGQAFDTTQPHWLLRFGHGSYHFVTLATPANDGRQWWSDNTTFTQAEQDEIEANLSSVGITNFCMMMGHHDLEEVENSNYIVAKMQRYGAKHYTHGHKHDLRLHVGESGILRYRIDSLGQRNQNNVAVWAIDNNTVTMTTFTHFDPWPVFVPTAPAPSQFVSDEDEVIDVPYIPSVPNSCEQAPIRVLAFDTTDISVVRVRIDNGQWIQLQAHATIPHQWRGSFDARNLAAGIHALHIEVTGTQTNAKAFSFTVEEGECDIGDEDDPAPLDEGEMIVFYPETDGDEDNPAEEADSDAEPEPETEPQPICTPGEKHCQETVLLVCSDDGMQWDLLENCGQQGTTCQDGACLAVDGDSDAETLCTPDEKRCNGSRIEKCASDGSAWEVYTDCAPRTCEEAMCVDVDGDVEQSGEGSETAETVKPVSSSSDGCTGGSSLLFALMAGMAVLRRRRR